MVEAAVKGFETKDESIARSVEPIEEVIDELKIELKNRHVRVLEMETVRSSRGLCFLILQQVLREWRTIVRMWQSVSVRCRRMPLIHTATWKK